MKYCVLGAGLMGKAVAYDLLLQKDTEKVILCDKDVRALHATPQQNDKRLETKVCDVGAYCNTPLQDIDVTVSAIHYSFNLDVTKACIKTRSHMCDLGGNSEIVDEQLKLNEDAKNAGISIVPDCGLAPGMVAVLVKWGIEKFNWCDTVKIRVGGLPQNPNNKLMYERLFSIDGLINEYIEPVRILRNGKIEIIEPLTEIEKIDFPSVGALESFTTSGGTSTLINTYKNRLKNLDYKTIRYKGHCEALKELQKNGQFTKEYFEANLPICTKDITLVKIIFEGGKGVACNAPTKKREIDIIDYAKPPFTSMMRMTAFPVSIIAQMLARGQIKEKGVVPQERCVPVDIFIEELKKREIKINGI